MITYEPFPYAYVIILPVKSIAWLTLPVSLLLFFSVLSCKDPVSHTDGKLRVLTTVAPLYSFTENIAGDAAHVENLLPAGAGPHEYSLSPDNAKDIADADVILKNGIGLESWLDSMLLSSGKGLRNQGKRFVVDTSIGTEIINGDPHIWLSPGNAIIQVKNIRDALIQADAPNIELYQRNAAVYIKRLEDLDREIRDEIASWKRTDFVSFHSAFAYFARDYGLTQAAVIQETYEVEPSPGHISEVIEIIKSRGIKSIFTERQASHKIVRSLADDLDLKVYSLDTLETGTPGKEWYLEKMKMNLNILKEALNL
jgi:zinc/manganese transport system substrate-binding protein